MNNLFLYWRPSFCMSSASRFRSVCGDGADILPGGSAGRHSGRGRARLPNRFWWFFSMLVPLLLSSLRVDMGTDYANYQYLYVELNKIQSFPQFVGTLICPNRLLYCSICLSRPCSMIRRWSSCCPPPSHSSLSMRR